MLSYILILLLSAPQPSVELEIDLFHDCHPVETGLECNISENIENRIGWIPALGVFLVVDEEEVSTAKAVGSTMPSGRKTFTFFKMDSTDSRQATTTTTITQELKNNYTTSTSITKFQSQLDQKVYENEKLFESAKQEPALDYPLPNPPPSEALPAGRQGEGIPRDQQIKVRYQYDALGRLVGRQSKEKKTSWAYFGLAKVVEYNPNQPLQTLEYFHGSEGINYIIPTLANSQGMPPPSQGWTLHKDNLGSTVVVTRETTDQAEEKNYYDPFGNAGPSRLGNPILYTGQYYDSLTQLYFFPARVYDPSTGKFLQRDPLGYFNGPNPTAYVGNSPYSFIDPLGLAAARVDVQSWGSDPKLIIFAREGFGMAAKALAMDARSAGVAYQIHYNVPNARYIADTANKIDSQTQGRLGFAILTHSSPGHEGTYSMTVGQPTVVSGNANALAAFTSLITPGEYRDEVDPGFYFKEDKTGLYPKLPQGADPSKAATIGELPLKDHYWFLTSCNTAIGAWDDPQNLTGHFSGAAAVLATQEGANFRNPSTLKRITDSDYYKGGRPAYLGAERSAKVFKGPRKNDPYKLETFVGIRKMIKTQREMIKDLLTPKK